MQLPEGNVKDQVKKVLMEKLGEERGLVKDASFDRESALGRKLDGKYA